MPPLDVQTVAAIIGLLLTGAGLLYAGSQLRETKRIARADYGGGGIGGGAELGAKKGQGFGANLNVDWVMQPALAEHALRDQYDDHETNCDNEGPIAHWIIVSIYLDP